jgi:hypothetical protein
MRTHATFDGLTFRLKAEIGGSLDLRYAGSRLSGLFTSKQGRQQQAVFSREK